MKRFATIYKAAVRRKGEDELQARFSEVRSPAELRDLPDDRALAAIAKCVFAAGFRWRVIQAKWDGFEDAFGGFLIDPIAEMDEDAVAGLRQDRRIVRNPQKIRSTIKNARFLQSVRDEHGSFGALLADWPEHDVVGLWAYLKKHGDRLGGNTGPRVLRLLGKDTFILTGDVTYALTEMGVMTAKPTSKTGKKQAQEAFTKWSEQSGRPMAEISVILACTVDRPPEEE